MKFILLLALVGCAVNVQVTAAAAVNTFYGTDADNAAPLSINAAANIAAAAPYPGAAPAASPTGAADPLTRTVKLVEKPLSDYAASAYSTLQGRRPPRRRSFSFLRRPAFRPRPAFHPRPAFRRRLSLGRRPFSRPHTTFHRRPRPSVRPRTFLGRRPSSRRTFWVRGVSSKKREDTKEDVRVHQGIGRRFSNVVCKKANIDLKKRAGELTEEEVERVLTVMSNPHLYKIPDWFLNRQKDIKDGKYSQMKANALDNKLREDLERLKKISAHRHFWDLRVRGQHTKTSGRRGRTVGVSKKK